MQTTTKTKYTPVRQKKNKTELITETISADPIFTSKELEQFKRNRAKLDTKFNPVKAKKNRQKLIKLLLECPVLNDEELQIFDETRKEINRCRLASL